MYTKLLLFVMLTPLLALKNHAPQPAENPTNAKAQLKIKLEPVLKNLAAPVAMAHAGDSRLFIVGQNGVINIVKDGKLLPEPFLDISFEVEHGKGYSEKGLLGLAFHPNYKSNGRFFVYYSTHYEAKGYDHKSLISEFKVSPDNPDKALPEERVLLEILQPEANHNGGQLAFGPDGGLYVGLGDGGGAGDKHGKTGNGQDLSNLLGKILKLNIDGKSRYTVPADNPFYNTPGARREIWAYGLRNPWRFSFDRKTHELYAGDVGQNTFEEIDIIQKGGNYGWRAMEGNHAYDKAIPNKDMKAPIFEYPHSEGVSVIGGYVYRGTKFPDLQGKYIYGDWNGKLWYLDKPAGKWVNHVISKENFMINSFGEDSEGELYVLGQEEQGVESTKGLLYKIVVLEEKAEK